MTRSKKLLLGALLLGSVSAVALPVIAADQASPAADATNAAWRGPDGRGGPFGGDRHGPARFGRDRDDRGDRGGPDGRMGEALLEMFDANKDGSIGKDEIAAATAGKLRTYDKDTDSALSLGEYQALWTEQTHERMVRSFQGYDRDGDAKVTEAELGSRTDRLVQHLDRNNDGAIDASELAGPRGPMGRGGPMGPGGPDGQGGPMGPGGPDGAGTPPAQ